MLLTAASGMMLKNEMANLTVAGQLTNLAVGFPARYAFKGDHTCVSQKESSKR